MSAQPDYVSFEPKGREEVLSHIGSFSPAERSVFQRLCDAWAPEIDVERFLRGARTSAEQELTALERLVAKLRTAQIGVLTTTATESGRTPDKVVLRSQGSPEFWAALLGETIDRLVSTEFNILPTEQRIREKKALPPDYHIVDANSSQLVAAYDGAADASSIFRIRLMGDFRVLFTGPTARSLITKALAVLRRDLAERGILEELARLKDSTITETRQRLESKAPDVWLDLTRTLVKERSTIAFRKNMDERDEIFQLAFLVMSFVDAQIGAARERKESDDLVEAELDTIAESVRNAATGTVSQDEFSVLVEDAQTRLAGAAATFSRKLQDELLSPKPRRKLARVLYIHGLYIHGTRVRSVFEQARSETGRRLTNQYTELMEAFLRGRTPEVGEIFKSRELLNQDIERRVERQHPLLGELIARPQLLAEGIIQDAKQRRESISTEELKGVLASYFNVDNSTLLPLNELFGLSIVTIFDDAFASASVFRQLLLRLSGRHESLRATYTRRFGPRPQQRTSFADEGPQ
ncbi:MAG TPA: hypothetical protein VKA06_03380, partial [Spirochaetia bacterium]|nr:hypothetical protein [Spirochaetia bacterium]